MAPDQLQSRLGHVFGDPRLLREALTHRSFGQPNNERFEFLGDSILNCVISIALFERFGGLREGDLSRVRASLVRQDALYRIALELELGAFLHLGEGELKSGGSKRPSILADALEAVFAAVFLDGGFDAAKQVIDRLYAPLLSEVDPRRPSKDAKTALQEWLQARRIAVPTYSMVQALGEAHAQEFEVACEVPKLGVRTLGRGPSRRIAEQQSAELALAALRKQ
ncbi:ribonuclease III [Thauera mechernichensis]|uniref:Ribonuclease 3 n=1 Tax=Thauera mechernichensis TaxID=82788 RepID=A0ABW3WFD8_9RHOO|nr:MULTISPECIES: ribonuclease III [Thauera]ENO80046.1 ribonuclease III [Thauera sp. 27]ENO92165.1 ribonuclease III [Thauera sp. 28]MDG3066787.1 ribonuclease III [Thauera mechernichensis]WBL62664.1 ribonuclease III [Thauera sp. WB-2]HAG75044.1 ribonuclease III [Thauera sp.]